MKWTNFSWSSLSSYCWHIYLLSLFLKYIFNGFLTFMVLLTFHLSYIPFQFKKYRIWHLSTLSKHLGAYFSNLIATEKNFQAILYLSLFASSVCTFSCLKCPKNFCAKNCYKKCEKMKVPFQYCLSQCLRFSHLASPGTMATRVPSGGHQIP